MEYIVLDDEAYQEKIPSEILTTSTLLPGPGSSIFDEQSQRYEKIEEKNDSYRLRGNFDMLFIRLRGKTCHKVYIVGIPKSVFRGKCPLGNFPFCSFRLCLFRRIIHGLVG